MTILLTAFNPNRSNDKHTYISTQGPLIRITPETPFSDEALFTRESGPIRPS